MAVAVAVASRASLCRNRPDGGAKNYPSYLWVACREAAGTR